MHNPSVISPDTLEPEFVEMKTKSYPITTDTATQVDFLESSVYMERMFICERFIFLEKVDGKMVPCQQSDAQTHARGPAPGAKIKFSAIEIKSNRKSKAVRASQQQVPRAKEEIL